MITDIDGIQVGHWTDLEARTGCTVALLPEGTVASGEVRGGAPATRETALLDPSRMVQRLDALVLCGGSAFGLAACDGVMTWCEEEGRGFETAGGIVPIVVGLGLYDLAVGDPAVRPDAAAGRAACAAAGPTTVLGRVGAGTGATVRKWGGADTRRDGGLVGHTERSGAIIVACLVAVNAWGDPGGEPDDVTASLVEHLADPDDAPSFGRPDDERARENTTIGLVATNARLDKLECQLVAQSAHHGLARAVVPSHTSGDGDAFVAAATQAVAAPVTLVRHLAATVVERAVRSLLFG